MFTIKFLSLYFLLHFSFLLFSSSFSDLSHNANDTKAGPAVSFSEVEGTSQVGDVNVASVTRIIDIEVDREIRRWPVTEYEPRY